MFLPITIVYFFFNFILIEKPIFRIIERRVNEIYQNMFEKSRLMGKATSEGR